MISRLINLVFRFFGSKDLKSDNKDHLETLTPDELGRLLLIAVWEKSMDVGYIKDLLDVGAPVNHKDEYGFTPLDVASLKKNREVINLLLFHGAVVYIQDVFGNMHEMTWESLGVDNVEVRKHFLSQRLASGFK